MALTLISAFVGTVHGDADKTIKLFIDCAKKGDHACQNNIGHAYFEKNKYKESYFWSFKSANQGNPVAQQRIARIYEKGLGRPQDYVKAYAWYCLCIASGLESNTLFRDLLEKKMTSEDVSKGQELASKLWQKIEENNSFSK